MLTVYTLEQYEQWDAVVRSFKDYDIYWLNGYVKAFQIHGDGNPLLFYFEGDEVRGINVVMKRDVADDERFAGIIDEGQYYDFVTPYGYGGWLIEGRNTKSLFESYDSWCRSNGVVSEFVRFHPMIGNHVYCKDYYEVIQLGEVVFMDLCSSEQIWENILGKNKNMIRKAVKNGVKIYNGRYPEIYETFRSIYNETMDKDDAEQYYYFEKEFYWSILEDLPRNAQVFYAEKDGTVIAASIMLTANRKMNYHLSGSLRNYCGLAPNNLLLYKAALWGFENGYETLYLGGGVGSSEDNLFKFKKSFCRLDDLPRFYVGKKIVNQEKFNKLVKIRNTLNDSNHFPAYRAE